MGKQGRQPVVVHICGSFEFEGIREAERILGINRTRLIHGLDDKQGVIPGTDNRLTIDYALEREGVEIKNDDIRVMRRSKKNG